MYESLWFSKIFITGLIYILCKFMFKIIQPLTHRDPNAESLIFTQTMRVKLSENYRLELINLITG